MDLFKFRMELFKMDIKMFIIKCSWEAALKRWLVRWESQGKCRINSLFKVIKELEMLKIKDYLIGKLLK
jgi:hypothetical protein